VTTTICDLLFVFLRTCVFQYFFYFFKDGDNVDAFLGSR